jgi:predicted RNA-binding protein
MCNCNKYFVGEEVIIEVICFSLEFSTIMFV